MMRGEVDENTINKARNDMAEARTNSASVRTGVTIWFLRLRRLIVYPIVSGCASRHMIVSSRSHSNEHISNGGRHE